MQAHQVDVWRVRLDRHADLVNFIESTLSTDETQRAARFHFEVDRNRFIVAHACLRLILARYLRCEPLQLDFSTNEYGKPAVLNDHKFEFNLTHSGDYALIAVTRERKVGVDVEHIRPGADLESLAARYFSQREVSELTVVPLEQKTIAFFNGWTRKEAYIKAQGLGLSLPLDGFDVSLSPGEPVILRATRPDPHEAARWTLLSLRVAPGYEGALAVEGHGLNFQYWDWNE